VSVTTAQGFTADGLACGIKPDGSPDLAVVLASAPVSAAAVFTRNEAAAPPVQLSRRHVADGSARMVVLTSGCANAATGEAGMRAATETAEAAARWVGCRPEEVLVCSTGPIGDVVPVDRIVAGLDRLRPGPEGGDRAAEAILTTDSRSKQAQTTAAGFAVGGMAKGAGMIRPDMATMLAVLTTDAEVDAASLDRALRRAVAVSFNALDVDGCESTNDTVVILASGESGVRPGEEELAKAVETVCRDLSHQMAADAEGASRVVTIEVRGAADDETALVFARAVADSALVRSSFYGADPNWGRVVAALGSARVPLDLGAVSVAYAGVEVARAGVDAGADHDALSARLEGDFRVDVTVGEGPGSCSLLTTDLTPDYVRFNGERS
jgi:glutamate N-acetyltransferase / amino-acid N-acetyltransferase